MSSAAPTAFDSPPEHVRSGPPSSASAPVFFAESGTANPAGEERRLLPWIWLAALIVVLPNAVAICRPKFVPANAIQVCHALGLLLVPCLLGLPVRKVLLAMLPLVALVPAAAIYQFITSYPPREWSFLALLETNSQEATQFLPAMLAAGLFSALIVWLYWRLVTRKIPGAFRLGWMGRFVVAALGLLLPLRDVIAFGPECGWTAISGRMADIYPFGTVMAAWKAVGIHSEISRHAHVPQNFTVTPARALPAGQREIHILVVGETARATSFQLNGYPRDTTPLLAQNPDVVSFKNVSAAAPCTLMSVPLLLTAANAPQVAHALSMPSSLSVFKKAGYRVHWLSTQRKHGQCDTTVSVFSDDADDAAFLSGTLDPGHGRYDTALDSDLLPRVQEILARHEPRVLLVLHTMGSHMPYHHRYPPEFNHFPADPAVCDTVNSLVPPNAEQKLHMANAYDNTVRFTDHVLSQLIGMLAAQNATSTLLYVSDHGENTGDSPTLPYAHGDLSEDVLHVPLLVWTSPQYRALCPTQNAALHAHADTPFSAATTFHLLLDLAGLQTNLSDPTQSAANPGFKPGPRLVACSLNWFQDYDKMFPQSPVSTSNPHTDSPAQTVAR